jgi:hypothetical protein
MMATVRERPILFSAPMVRAILDGRKTQTRRLARVTHPWFKPGDIRGCPHGEPGDRLWVRETWGQDTSGKVWYRASCEEGNTPNYGWRPSIHLRRRDSRIDLEVTGVRVERLQAISHEDARAEGVMSMSESEVRSMTPKGRTWTRGPAVARFECLWDAINGKRSAWASNPWVWVIDFKRVRP